MEVDQFLGDKQPESQALAIVIDGIGILIEALEDQSSGLRADAASGVGDRNINEIRIGLDHAGLHRHGLRRRAVNLMALSMQIHEDFENAVGIAVDKGMCGSTAASSPTAFSWAVGRIIATAWRISSAIAIQRGSMRSCQSRRAWLPAGRGSSRATG